MTKGRISHFDQPSISHHEPPETVGYYWYNSQHQRTKAASHSRGYINTWKKMTLTIKIKKPRRMKLSSGIELRPLEPKLPVSNPVTDLFFDIRKYSLCLDIKKSIFWYQEIHFLISRNPFSDIKKSIFWYQEIEFLISKNKE